MTLATKYENNKEYSLLKTVLLLFDIDDTEINTENMSGIFVIIFKNEPIKEEDYTGKEKVFDALSYLKKFVAERGIPDISSLYNGLRAYKEQHIKFVENIVNCNIFDEMDITTSYLRNLEERGNTAISNSVSINCFMEDVDKTLHERKIFKAERVSASKKHSAIDSPSNKPAAKVSKSGRKFGLHERGKKNRIIADRKAGETSLLRGNS
jgi:hypothetical protein